MPPFWSRRLALGTANKAMHALMMAPDTWRHYTLTAKLHVASAGCAFASFAGRVRPDAINLRLHIVPEGRPTTGEADVRAWCAGAVADMRDNLHASLQHITNLGELVLVDDAENRTLAFLGLNGVTDSLTALQRLEIATRATRQSPEYWPRGLDLVTSLRRLKMPVRERIPEGLSRLSGLLEFVMVPHTHPLARRGPLLGMEHLPAGLGVLTLVGVGPSLRCLSRLTSLAQLNMSLVDRDHPDHPAALAALDAPDALPTSLRTLTLAHGPSEVPRCLARMRDLKHIFLVHCELEHTAGLADLGALTALRMVDCHGSGPPMDLTPVSGLSSLRALCVRSSPSRVGRIGVADLEPLRSLTALTSLDIDVSCNAVDLAPLDALTRLHVLGLVYTHAPALALHAPRRGIPAHISRLVSLRSLHILDCTWASDFRALASMTALTSLALPGSLRGAIPSSVSKLTRLVKLDISRGGQPVSRGFQHLRGLPALRQLTVSDTLPPASKAHLHAAMPDAIIVPGAHPAV